MNNWKLSLEQQWSAGNFQSIEPNETNVQNAQALGQVKQLKQLIELDYEQFADGVTEDDE